MVNDYTINENGIIQNPGKFEGEPSYAPYFYDNMLEGGADDRFDDEHGHCVDVFVVTADDRKQYPALESVYAIVLWEDDNGFVNTRELSERELSTWQAELAGADDDEPTEPDESDITTTDHKTFYQDGRKVLEYDPEHKGAYAYINGAKFLGRFDSCKEAVRAYMNRVQFWPNVWFISDHGNAHLMTIAEDK